ncbi:MAG: organic solvent tolerance protein OstA [Bacteroidetes bacterium]|nr:MAG: organic solvent tolerance protein OstA [Bacteroidota bacterium]
MRSGTRRGWGGILCWIGLLLVAAVRPAPAQEAPPDTTQDVVLIRQADRGTRQVEDGEPVRRLAGHVHLQQGETYLWADEARQYEQRGEIVFRGDVRIVERGDSLSADTVFYDSNTKVGRARGRVELTDGDVLVFAPSGLYFTREKRAQFEEGVTMVDSASTLRSRAGQYWSEEKRAVFYGDVRLDARASRLEADSVTYFRETEVADARGHVFIERFGDTDAGDQPDSSAVTLLFGERAYNDDPNGLSRMEVDALLIQLRADTAAADPSIDTLLIRADRLEASRRDSLRRLIAVGDVQIWQRGFAARADSVVYDRIERVTRDELGREQTERIEDVRLFRQPIGWFEQTQVSGDTLRVTRRGGRTDSLIVRGQAFVAQRDTLLDRIQQLQGRHLVGLFEQDSLRRLDVGPNAEAIYYLAEDDRPNGGVQLSGDRIVFRFEGGTLKRIRGLRGIEGTYYPEELLPASFQLSRYRWEPERRPADTSLLDREDVPGPLDAALERLQARGRPTSGEGASPAVSDPPG